MRVEIFGQNFPQSTVLISFTVVSHCACLHESPYPMTAALMIVRSVNVTRVWGVACLSHNHAAAIVRSVLTPVFETVIDEASAFLSV